MVIGKMPEKSRRWYTCKWVDGIVTVLSPLTVVYNSALFSTTLPKKIEKMQVTGGKSSYPRCAVAKNFLEDDLLVTFSVWSCKLLWILLTRLTGAAVRAYTTLSHESSGELSS